MQNQAKVGPVQLSEGAETSLRADRQGSQVVTEAHGRYSEAVGRNKVFNACNSAGSTLIGATTSPMSGGFMLYNPVGSGVRLSLLEILFVQTSTAAAATSMIYLSANSNSGAVVPSTTTSIAVRNCLLGSTQAGAGVAYSIATSSSIASDAIIRPIWAASVSATATTGVPAPIKDEVAGAIEILPGCWVKMSATASITGITSMTWEEIPI